MDEAFQFLAQSGDVLLGIRSYYSLSRQIIRLQVGLPNASLRRTPNQ
uniref:Uncharacterized protein n=1 Tax=Arundo donax TaxID=35708 RepID=A0A0A9F676_ARUDO